MATGMPLNLATLTDPAKLKIFYQQHEKECKGYAGFAAFVLVIFWFFSDGDFSFLLTLGSLISMVSFLMIVVSIEAAKASRGISLKMMECYVFLCFARLIAIIPFEGYLPYDSSGDWLYQVIEAFTFCLAGSIVYLCRVRYRDTYDPTTDTMNHVYLVVPAFVLACIFHPSLNSFMPSDICWAFALYLESVAGLPQLFMFQREGRVEPWTAHFLFAQVISKAVSFVFWISSFSELSDPTHHVKSFVGYWVITMQGLQILIMGDFIYQYVRCIQKGVPLNQLLSDAV